MMPYVNILQASVGDWPHGCAGHTQGRNTRESGLQAGAVRERHLDTAWQKGRMSQPDGGSLLQDGIQGSGP